MNSSLDSWFILTDIGILDETKAALRLLLTIYKSERPLGREDIFDSIYREYGVARTAVYTALRACIKLGLIYEKPVRIGRNPRPTLLHFLTDKGKRAAKIIVELEKALKEE